MKFIWRDHDKTFASVEKPTFAEIDHAERLVRASMDEWTPATRSRIAIFWAVYRVDPQLLSWEALGELGPEDFDVIDDDEVPAGGDVVPPAPTPSDSPDGPVAAAGSSQTAGAITSST